MLPDESLSLPSFLAMLFTVLVTVDLSPSRWVPPSPVLYPVSCSDRAVEEEGSGGSMSWCGMAWRRIASYRIAAHGSALHGLASHRITRHRARVKNPCKPHTMCIPDAVSEGDERIGVHVAAPRQARLDLDVAALTESTDDLR